MRTDRQTYKSNIISDTFTPFTWRKQPKEEKDREEVRDYDYESNYDVNHPVKQQVHWAGLHHVNLSINLRHSLHNLHVLSLYIFIMLITNAIG